MLISKVHSDDDDNDDDDDDDNDDDGFLGWMTKEQLEAAFPEMIIFKKPYHCIVSQIAVSQIAEAATCCATSAPRQWCKSTPVSISNEANK